MVKVISSIGIVVSLCLLGLVGAARASAETTDIATRTDEEARTIAVYKATNEAVAFILTKSLSMDPYDVLPEAKSVEGSGSGIVVDGEKGIIITNLHVIQDAQKIEISLADGHNYQARLVGYDRDFDIAVLQLKSPPPNLTSIPFADSSKLEVGQRVLAIGNPFGLNRTLTGGIISSLDRVVKSPQGIAMRGLIQTDAAINPGNSGGPLLDADGRLIGMNTAILSQSGDSAGIGFAVPINQIRRILPELIATGKVLRPRLGWILDDTNQGAMVKWVAKGSPAESAGIEPAYRLVASAFLRGYILDYSRADLIYSVNGKRVVTKDEVEDIVSQSVPGKAIEFVLRRGGIEGRERIVLLTPALR